MNCKVGLRSLGVASAALIACTGGAAHATLLFDANGTYTSVRNLSGYGPYVGAPPLDFAIKFSFSNPGSSYTYVGDVSSVRLGGKELDLTGAYSHAIVGFDSVSLQVFVQDMVFQFGYYDLQRPDVEIPSASQFYDTQPLIASLYSGWRVPVNYFGYQSIYEDVTGFKLTVSGDSPSSSSVPFDPRLPEPATWLTMVVGFGAIGFGMRRKQRRTVRYNFA